MSSAVDASSPLRAQAANSSSLGTMTLLEPAELGTPSPTTQAEGGYAGICAIIALLCGSSRSAGSRGPGLLRRLADQEYQVRLRSRRRSRRSRRARCWLGAAGVL